MRLLLLPLLLALTPAGPCPCPESIGATAGAAPLLVVPGAPGRGPSLVACGYAEPSPHAAIRASEFEVFSCGHKEALLTFGALQTATLRRHGRSLEITELARWPFGNDWRWVDVPLWRYVVTPGTPPSVRKVLLLAPPALSPERIAAVLQEYAEALGSGGVSLKTEDLIGRVFAAALAGDPNARTALAEMRETLALDGASAEVWKQAFGTYQLYARLTQKVPIIPGV